MKDLISLSDEDPADLATPLADHYLQKLPPVIIENIEDNPRQKVREKRSNAGKNIMT
jgi:hypothetical protein